jgi:hypothetical protein
MSVAYLIYLIALTASKISLQIIGHKNNAKKFSLGNNCTLLDPLHKYPHNEP